MKYTEKLLTRSKEHLMNVRYANLEGTNREIGRKLAEMIIKNHSNSNEATKSDDISMSKQRMNYFTHNYPLIVERAKGVADSFGIDYENPLYDCFSLPYNNLDMSKEFGCSSIYFSPASTNANTGILSRNYDFVRGSNFELFGLQIPEEMKNVRPIMGDPYILKIYPEDGGYASLYISAFEHLSGVLDGINSEGLMICVNGDEIAMAKNSNQRITNVGVGFNELQSMRYLLDNCASVEEAKRALLQNKHYFTNIPCHYLIADREGNSFVFEFSPDRSNAQVIENKGKYQLLTNHPLSQFSERKIVRFFLKTFPEKFSLVKTGTSSFQRYKQLEVFLKGNNKKYTKEFIKKTNSEVTTSKVAEWIPDIYRKEVVNQPGFSRTLWHSLYDGNERSLEVKFYLKENQKENGNFDETFSEYYKFEL